MKEKLVIIGTGLNAKRAYSFICHHDLFDVIGFAVNEEYKLSDTFLGKPVYTIEELDSVVDKREVKVFVALLWNHLNADRKKLYEELKAKGYRFANLISPLASVYSQIPPESNCWINDFVIILNDVVIGENASIASSVEIAEESVIGAHCYIGAKSMIAGKCVIGDQTFVGLSCTVFDQTTVGEKCILGACVAVKRNVPAYSVYKTSSDFVIKQYDASEIENKLVSSKSIR